MTYYINGIQQVGIGVNHVYKAWDWYKKYFHFDLPIFDEAAEAKLMLPHTDGLPRTRHAILALNYQGGGGLEIWQHTSFESKAPDFDILPGDLGIGILKIKVKDIQNSFDYFTKEGLNLLTNVVVDPIGRPHFYLKDPYNNLIEIVQSNDWHADKNLHSGGVYGAVIGVSDMDKALQLYKDLLKYEVIVSDTTGTFDDYDLLTKNSNQYRRVILTHADQRNGAFSRLLGKTEIELVQVNDRTPNKIFENRIWGELGYIHLCFDINNMDVLKSEFAKKGFPFTVDSANSFDMGEAAGRFAYIEDPDGTLIEFVETHKIPILKKLNLYYDLRKRPAQKPLPALLLWAMSLMRVK
jgi:catechol 2,3-dioxygenase-like lactoylglutathione lyase family enzyme